MRSKPYEFQVACGFSEPDKRSGESVGVSVDTVSWGGHFREDEDDETGVALAVLNGEGRDV